MSQRRSQRIPRVLCAPLPTPQAPIKLDEDEAAHLQQALRIRPGDPVIAVDGRGSEISASTLIRDKKLWLETTASVPSRTIPLEKETTGLVLEVAILKGDAMSWVIEKAVELGANRIIPVECDHGVVEVGKKGAEHFVERWQRIADQSLKQCERLNRLTVEAPRTFEELLKSAPQGARRAVAIEPSAGISDALALPKLAAGLAPGERLHVLIGPEGGFSAQELDTLRAEIKMGRATAVNLGSLVLRAETAALFALSSMLNARIS
jgi:16S rRNA (uracil1498-N3)-methyltransferase